MLHSHQPLASRVCAKYKPIKVVTEGSDGRRLGALFKIFIDNDIMLANSTVSTLKYMYGRK